MNRSALGGQPGNHLAVHEGRRRLGTNQTRLQQNSAGIEFPVGARLTSIVDLKAIISLRLDIRQDLPCLLHRTPWFPVNAIEIRQPPATVRRLRHPSQASMLHSSDISSTSEMGDPPNSNCKEGLPLSSGFIRSFGKPASDQLGKLGSLRD